tara:strand:- start:12813 stop:13112 length:300 start_codon:yes stop_codon:yes gene_type:complete
MKNGILISLTVVFFLITAFTIANESDVNNAAPKFKVVVNNSTNSASIEVGSDFNKSFALDSIADRYMFQKSILALQLLEIKRSKLTTTDNGKSFLIEKK